MKPCMFRYLRAGSVEEAVDLLAQHGDEAKLLAGGQSLIPLMNLRLARPTVLIDVNRVDLTHLEAGPEGVRVGALTRHDQIRRASHEGSTIGVLARTAPLIGHHPIRTRGTFGGSLAHADPAAEWCVLTLALDGEIVVRSRAEERAIPASSFFSSYFTTALEPTELVTEVRFPWEAGAASLREFSRRDGDFAIVLAAAAVDADGAGRCTRVSVALGGVAPTPVRVAEAERALLGERLDRTAIANAAEAVVDQIEPPADLQGSASYRRRVARGLVTAVLEDCRQDLATKGRLIPIGD